MVSDNILSFNSFIALSLDGYIADHNNTVDFLDKYNNLGHDYNYAKYLDEQEAVLMGSNTYKFLDKLEVNPFGNKPVYVLTNSLRYTKSKLFPVINFYDNLEKVIENLAINKFCKVHLEGGSLVGDFTYNKIINNLYVNLVPELLGQGYPLFQKQEQPLDVILNVKSIYKFENGLIQIHYQG